MPRVNGRTNQLLAALAKIGAGTARQLADLVGCDQKNVGSLIHPSIEKGLIGVDYTRIESGGQRHRVAIYTWLGPIVAADEGPLPARRASTPHQPGMRRCLGCGRSFKSAHAGNRLCPNCAAGAKRSGGNSPFDTPAVVRYH